MDMEAELEAIKIRYREKIEYYENALNIIKKQ